MPRTYSALGLGAAFLLLVPQISAQTPIEPVTGEYQINTYTTGDQGAADVAVDGDGDFIVVWESETAADAPVRSILGQRFASSGDPAGGEFRISISTSEDNLEAAVSAIEDGDFVVAWAGPGFLPASKNLVGQIFDSTGTLVDSFQGNLSSAGNVRSAAVAMIADGSFVVAWDDSDSSDTDTDGRGIQVRRFDSQGKPLDDPFQVNSYTTGDQTDPAIATDSAGGFVVVWESETAAGSPVRTVLGQRFDSSGTSLGDEFRVSFDTTEDNVDVDVAMAGGGDFVVVWAGKGYLPESKNLVGRRYDAAGNSVDSFLANLSSAGSVRSATVSMDAEGRFLVSWDEAFSADTDIDGRSVHARLYDSDGTADGNPFQVNTFTSGDQRLAAVGLAGERAVIAWDSGASDADGPDGDGIGVQGVVLGLGIFGDGFESGDLSAWTSSSP